MIPVQQLMEPWLWQCSVEGCVAGGPGAQSKEQGVETGKKPGKSW